MTPNDVIMIATIVLAFFVVVMSITGLVLWIMPRFQSMEAGRGFFGKPDVALDYKPCCPAGLGCNDREGKYNRCRRDLALAYSTVEEGQALDELYSIYCEEPTLDNLRRFQYRRDTLIAEHISDKLTSGEQRSLLMSSNNERLIPRVTGRVLED